MTCDEQAETCDIETPSDLSVCVVVGDILDVPPQPGDAHRGHPPARETRESEIYKL